MTQVPPSAEDLKAFRHRSLMKRLSSALALAASSLLLPSFADGQIVSVYGTVSVPHFSNVPTGSVCNGSGCVTQTTSLTPVGFGGGVTLNFLSLPFISLGFDLRGSTKSGTVGADTGLFGLKATFKPPVLKLKPYVQVSGGYFATRTANVSTSASPPYPPLGGTYTNQGGMYEVLGGLDVPIVHFVDVRVIEIGGGQAFGLFNNQTSGVFTFNSGLVLHF